MLNRSEHYITNGIIEENDLQKALEISKNSNESLETVLINNFQVSKDAIGKSLSVYFNCEFIPYGPKMPIATELFQNLHRTQLLSECWVPISWDRNGVVVQVDDPFDFVKRNEIESTMDPCPIIYAVGIKEDIIALIHRSFDEIESGNFYLELKSGENPIDAEKVVDFMLLEAYKNNASGINFEISEAPNKERVMFLINDQYLEYMSVSVAGADAIKKHIKSMAGLDVNDVCIPKIGHINFKRDYIPDFRITVNTYPSEEQREIVSLTISEIEIQKNDGDILGIK